MNNQNVGLFYIKLGCLLFWASWFALAFATNVFDFIAVAGWLPESWRFRSGNYALLQTVLHIYATPSVVLNVLFTCDIAAQGLSALLFFFAFVKCWLHKNAWPFINAAFAVSLALWAVFLVMEEFFIAYTYEGVHTGLFMFELISLMAIHLLPQNDN